MRKRLYKCFRRSVADCFNSRSLRTDLSAQKIVHTPYEVGGIFQLFAADEQRLIEQHKRNIGNAFFVLGVFELLHDRMIAFISRLNPHSNRAMLDCRVPIFLGKLLLYHFLFSPHLYNPAYQFIFKCKRAVYVSGNYYPACLRYPKHQPHRHIACCRYPLFQDDALYANRLRLKLRQSARGGNAARGSNPA